MDDWFPIQYKGKQSGQIHLKGVWTPQQQQKVNAGIAAANQQVQ